MSVDSLCAYINVLYKSNYYSLCTYCVLADTKDGETKIPRSNLAKVKQIVKKD